MKNFARNSIVQKSIIALVVVIITFTSVFTPRVYAEGDDWGIGGTLAKELFKFVVFLTDLFTGLLNNMMLGVEWGDINIREDNPNLTSGWVNAAGEDADVELKAGEVAPGTFDREGLEIPNILYCPENIFANNIAALDVNFLRPNTYSSVVKSGDNDVEETAAEKQQSAAGNLSKTIASWYKSFRNISVVGLLSVLIYIGIRILISSTAADKAKYKENLKDWFTALCLIFVIHLIMSGVLMLTDRINALFAQNINDGIVVQSADLSGEGKFRTNLTGYIRYRTQSTDVAQAAGYTIMYIAIVIYTVMFTVTYFKRFLYMGFFTMIAPLVALTYPLDKLGDGKSQAFNMWFKEYTMNAIIQPIHLILYTVFVSSAISFTDKSGFNIIYALVAIGFMLPAEKFIKEMFGLNKAKSTGSMESFAGGALAMKGLDKLASMVLMLKEKFKEKTIAKMRMKMQEILNLQIQMDMEN